MAKVFASLREGDFASTKLWYIWLLMFVLQIVIVVDVCFIFFEILI